MTELEELRREIEALPDILIMTGAEKRVFEGTVKLVLSKLDRIAQRAPEQIDDGVVEMHRWWREQESSRQISPKSPPDEHSFNPVSAHALLTGVLTGGSTGDNIGVLIGDKLIHNGDPGVVIGFSPHDGWVIVECWWSGWPIVFRMHPDVARRAVDAAKE